jgi:hypothetical protein
VLQQVAEDHSGESLVFFGTNQLLTEMDFRSLLESQAQAHNSGLVATIANKQNREAIHRLAIRRGGLRNVFL